jgi:hypothetical protein
MISLFTFAGPVFAALNQQVHELADMVVRFVEFIVTSLFW